MESHQEQARLEESDDFTSREVDVEHGAETSRCLGDRSETRAITLHDGNARLGRHEAAQHRRGMNLDSYELLVDRLLS